MNQQLFLDLFSDNNNLLTALRNFCIKSIQTYYNVKIEVDSKFIKVDRNPIDFFNLQGLDFYQDLFIIPEDGYGWRISEKNLDKHFPENVAILEKGVL